jgi:hypothetical protein
MSPGKTRTLRNIPLRGKKQKSAKNDLTRHHHFRDGYPLYTKSLFDLMFLAARFLGGHSECYTGCEEGDEDVKSGWKPPPRIPIPRNA